MGDSANIAIIGAGVVGMTVARLLQAEKKHYNITMIADAFKRDTSSAVAGCMFLPSEHFRGPTEAITKKWIDDSWYYWLDVLKSPEGQEAGLMTVPVYAYSNDNVGYTRNPLIEHLVPMYRAVENHELHLCSKPSRFGSCFSTLSIDCELFLPWAQNKFIQDGGKIIKATVDSFGSLAGKYDLVFNCAGIGARRLCNDRDLVAIRGQVLKAEAPWIKTAMYQDLDTMVVPSSDGSITIGGVRQYNNFSTEPSHRDADRVMSRCCKMLPALGDAEIYEVRVGLRPYRDTVRVESEIKEGVRVVHCYGHGYSGVTCAPGTAIDAVAKGVNWLKQKKNKL